MFASSKNSNGVSVGFFAVLLAALFCLFTIAPKATLAQSSNTGTVSGTVTDNTGAVVPDAAVTLTDKATGKPMAGVLVDPFAGRRISTR